MKLPFLQIPISTPIRGDEFFSVSRIKMIVMQKKCGNI